jgi:hypothetical protein
MFVFEKSPPKEWLRTKIVCTSEHPALGPPTPFVNLLAYMPKSIPSCATRAVQSSKNKSPNLRERVHIRLVCNAVIVI